MPGGRSATTADDARSRFHKAGGMLGELLRRQIVTSVGAGNTGVRLRDDGKRRVFSHFGYDRNEFVGSHGTVDAYRVRAERGQAYSRGRNITARKSPPVLLKCHGHEHGKRCCFLRRQKRGFRLVKIHHRFDKDQIRARIRARGHLRFEKTDGVFKRKRSERFEKFSERTDIESDKPAELIRHPFCGGNGGESHLFAGSAASLHFRDACPERI